MKNIHVLPTTQKSKIFFNHNKGFEKYQFSKEPFVNGLTNTTNQNIYITSDEEIKEGDNVKDKWVISEYGFVIKADRIENNYLIHSNGGSNFLHHYKFVILTTDQNLIKDSVQAIDDDFLEWFVKNPSCEEVEVEKIEVEDYVGFAGHTGYPTFHNEYKIIIPKEEPFKHESKVLTTEEVMEGRSSAYEFIDFDKQETLEEVAKNYATDMSGTYYEELDNSFKAGAKWQQERILELLKTNGYEDEPVFDLINNYLK